MASYQWIPNFLSRRTLEDSDEQRNDVEYEVDYNQALNKPVLRTAVVRDKYANVLEQDGILDEEDDDRVKDFNIVPKLMRMKIQLSFSSAASLSLLRNSPCRKESNFE